MIMKSRSRKIVHTNKLLTIRSLERRKIIEKLGCKCHWCGVFTDNSVYGEGTPRETTIDHIYNKLDPRRSGNNDKVVVACEACNQMRGRIAEFVFGRQFAIRHAANIKPIAVIPQVEIPNESEITHVEVSQVVSSRQNVFVIGPVHGSQVVRHEPLTLWECLSIWVGVKYRKWFKKKAK